MIIARVISTNRISLDDGVPVDVVVAFPGGREDAHITTDPAGVVKACEHFDSGMVEMTISQSERNQLRVEILNEETEEGEHDTVLKYLRAIFNEQKASE